VLAFRFGKRRARRETAKLPGNLVIVVGAGASHDVSLDHRDVNERWRPPLTDMLFTTNYEELLSPYSLSRDLSVAIRDGLREGEPLEALLAQLAARPEPDYQTRLRQVPLYIRDVVTTCSRDFELRHAAR
jgi:hypothetical protein